MVVLPTEDELAGRTMPEWLQDMHESMGYVDPPAKLVQETWEKEVLPAVIVHDEDGKPHISIELLKGEMYELLWARDTARKVYLHITGGLTDNLTISHEGIIALAERRVEERVHAGIQQYLARRADPDITVVRTVETPSPNRPETPSPNQVLTLEDAPDE